MPPPVIAHGWRIFAHPLFLAQVEALACEVEQLRRKDPDGYRHKAPAKRLAAITKLSFDLIPENPARDQYRQGGTLGAGHAHWRRAKFFQQYRLFFRYHAASKIIVLAWVNDETSKRAYGSRRDAYRVFQQMLNTGHPPDDWDQLLAEAQACGQDWSRQWPA